MPSYCTENQESETRAVAKFEGASLRATNMFAFSSARCDVTMRTALERLHSARPLLTYACTVIDASIPENKKILHWRRVYVATPNTDDLLTYFLRKCISHTDVKVLLCLYVMGCLHEVLINCKTFTLFWGRG